MKARDIYSSYLLIVGAMCLVLGIGNWIVVLQFRDPIGHYVVGGIVQVSIPSRCSGVFDTSDFVAG